MKGPTILIPALLGLLTLAGLVLALASDDRSNWIAALCLAPSVVVAVRTIARGMAPRRLP